MNTPTVVRAPQPQKTPDHLRALQRWLALEDYYTSDYVRKWLERTPDAEANEALALIAANAQPEPHSLLAMLLSGLKMIFTTSEIVSERNPAGRKAGTRAAMLLLSRNDVRGLPALIRVFETSGWWAGKYQDDIEELLLRFFSQPAEHWEGNTHAEEIRSLAERIWQSGKGAGALSTRRADLLIAALRSLPPQESASRSLLQRIAEAKTGGENRRRVQATAQNLLNL